ncbi:MAG: HNH endonuclease signature motif containing protein [Planctomycetota bacterium]
MKTPQVRGTPASKAAANARRPSFRQRGYGTRWDKLSRRFRQENPLCVECLSHGVTTPSQVTDHIVPHRGDEALLWDESNLQALCHTCHNRKTRRGE